MDKDEFSFAEPIKAVLRSHGISQKELADKLGKSYVGVKQMIARDMRVSSLFAIADTIGCSPKEFFDIDEKKDLFNSAAGVEIDSEGNYIFHCPHCGKETKYKRNVSFTEAQ